MDPELARAAIIDELDYFNSKVWELTTYAEASTIPGGVIVGGKWALCNKEDLNKPNMRARYVATEVNKGHDDTFYASTPPLEITAATTIPFLFLFAKSQQNSLRVR